MSKYNIGQILINKEDMELEGVLGKKTKVKAGTKIFIGADNFAHYLNGIIQPLGKNTAEGYSVKGIAEWVYMWVSRHLPLDDFLEEYDFTEKEFKEEIEDALEELGMWGNTGNRS
jgi:hypothetical protein